MREIKFRGFSIDTEEWVYGLLVYNCYQNLCIQIKATEYSFLKLIQIIPESVSQYIGIKDKNRQEIYERDIVVCYKENGIESYRGVVQYMKTSLQFMICNDKGGYSFVNGQVFNERPEYHSYEVICSAMSREA